MIAELKKLKERKELKLTDRAILSIIKESGLEGLKMKDYEIQDLLNLSKGALYNSFNKLKALGYIYNDNKEGRTRIIKLSQNIDNGIKQKYIES
jgi:uncharacterized membrane protein